MWEDSQPYTPTEINDYTGIHGQKLLQEMSRVHTGSFINTVEQKKLRIISPEKKEDNFILLVSSHPTSWHSIFPARKSSSLQDKKNELPDSLATQGVANGATLVSLCPNWQCWDVLRQLETKNKIRDYYWRIGSRSDPSSQRLTLQTNSGDSPLMKPRPAQLLWTMVDLASFHPASIFIHWCQSPESLSTTTGAWEWSL